MSKILFLRLICRNVLETRSFLREIKKFSHILAIRYLNSYVKKCLY